MAGDVDKLEAYQMCMGHLAVDLVDGDLQNAKNKRLLFEHVNYILDLREPNAEPAAAAVCGTAASTSTAVVRGIAADSVLGKRGASTP